jgi:hypothetical protein
MLRGRRAVGRRGPGLIGVAARTAVVAGTATAVSGGVARRQAARAEEKEQEQYEAQMAQQASYAPPPSAASAESGGISDDAIAKLQSLAELHKQGVLTEEEFAAQKAKILGM